MQNLYLPLTKPVAGSRAISPAHSLGQWLASTLAKLVTKLSLCLLGLTVIGACASNPDRPNRQVAVYTGFSRVTYVPVSQYSCRGGQVVLVTQAGVAEGTPVETSATSSVSLAGRRCYYADGYGRPIDATIAVEGGVGGVGGISTGINTSTGIGGGSINAGSRVNLP